MRHVTGFMVLSLCGMAAVADPLPTQSVPAAPLYLTFEQGRWGLIDERGGVVLPARFDQIDGRPSNWTPGPALPRSVEASIEIGHARPLLGSVFPVRLNGQAALATRGGQLLALGRYEQIRGPIEDDRIAVRANGRFGFADGRGELAIPARFDDVRSFEAGFAFVKSGARWGVIDRDGRTVVAASWDEVDDFPGDRQARARIGDRWGVVERSGKTVIPVRYEEIGRPFPPLIFAVDSGRPVYLRLDGTAAFRLECPRRKSATGFPFFEEKAAVVRCGDDDWGLIDAQGRFVVEPAWESVGPFFEGRAVLTSARKSAVVDSAGRFVLPPGKLRPGHYSEGLAVVQGSDSRIGFIDMSGRIVIPLMFDWANSFTNGFAPARAQGGKTGYIDRTGSWAIDPRFRSGSLFHGPLAAVEIPVAPDTLEISYIDRAGNVVHRMRFSGFIFDEEELQRFR